MKHLYRGDVLLRKSLSISHTVVKHLYRGDVLLRKSSSQRLVGSVLSHAFISSFLRSTLHSSSPRTSQELTKSDTSVLFFPVADNQSSLGSPLLVPRSPRHAHKKETTVDQKSKHKNCSIMIHS